MKLSFASCQELQYRLFYIRAAQNTSSNYFAEYEYPPEYFAVAATRCRIVVDFHRVLCTGGSPSNETPNQKCEIQGPSPSMEIFNVVL